MNNPVPSIHLSLKLRSDLQRLNTFCQNVQPPPPTNGVEGNGEFGNLDEADDEDYMEWEEEYGMGGGCAGECQNNSRHNQIRLHRGPIRLLFRNSEGFLAAFSAAFLACTQWNKFMSKNLNFALEISCGGQGQTHVGGTTKKREISRTA